MESLLGFGESLVLGTLLIGSLVVDRPENLSLFGSKIEFCRKICDVLGADTLLGVILKSLDIFFGKSLLLVILGRQSYTHHQS